MRVESESMMSRLVFGGGNDAGGWTKSARTWASVGAATWWKRLLRSSGMAPCGEAAAVPLSGTGAPWGAEKTRRSRWGTRGAHAASARS
jgi:hypothetical protein